MELTISVPSGDQRLNMIGPGEQNLKIIREALGVTIAARADALRVTGASRAVGQAAHVLELLAIAARRRRPMNRQQVLDAISAVGYSNDTLAMSLPDGGTLDLTDERPERSAMTQEHLGDRIVRRKHATAHDLPRNQHHHRPEPRPTAIERHMPPAPIDEENDDESADAVLDVYLHGRQIRAMTAGQKRYLLEIHKHDMTFCIGPAGTGKTYLAVAAATSMLRRGVVRKLVLVRPAVEAGEKLGFLPGDMQEKVNPFLRPLLDALHDMMDFEQIQRFLDSDLIEICPLAFMRGRTLNDSIIILDEAQNTSKAQMLMFLTRLGHGSKMIITGDTSQIDLADPRESGLIDAARKLIRVPGISFVTLEKTDIVRHSLVQRIVEAYAPPPEDG